MKTPLFCCLVCAVTAIVVFFIYSGTRALQETVGLNWTTTLRSFLVLLLCAALIWGGAVWFDARLFGDARGRALKLLMVILCATITAGLVAELVIIGDEMTFAREVAEQQKLHRVDEMHRPRIWPNSKSDLWFTAERGYYSTD